MEELTKPGWTLRVWQMENAKWKVCSEGKGVGEWPVRIDIKAKSQNPKPKSFVFIVISMRNIASAGTRLGVKEG